MKFTLILIALLISTALALPIQTSEEDIKFKRDVSESTEFTEKYLEKFADDIGSNPGPGRKMRKRDQPTQAQIDKYNEFADVGKRDVGESYNQITQAQPDEYNGPGKRDAGESYNQITQAQPDEYNGPGKRDIGDRKA
ncbi:10768_t:CDS:2 [Funneliformis geosporum]|uniref:16035_t:CDS:1 n=1 Tax=Funneliformis geosporum TaxID=1117311 RepID=A0A9W4SIT3_9GLOM|nr:16035_t:CDS:2 [Funneliformis geosporum]CAI2175274.1 10768_t:CDS:2 [Funneliformis geosporum]